MTAAQLVGRRVSIRSVLALYDGLTGAVDEVRAVPTFKTGKRQGQPIPTLDYCVSVRFDAGPGGQTGAWFRPDEVIVGGPE